MMPSREPPKIDIGELTDAVVTSVRRALQERQPEEALVFTNPRIICGIILDPATGGLPPAEGPPAKQ